MSLTQVLAAAAAVVVLAAAVKWRDRLAIERKLVVAALVVALGLYASGVLSDLPDVDEIISDVSETLGVWTYPIVAVIAFLETAAFVGLAVPGETVVIAGGVVAGQGEINIVYLIGLVWTAVVLGDSVGYLIGHRLGREFLRRHGSRVGITEERLQYIDGYFERRGGATIVLGRFVGFGRALVPFICGAAKMPYRSYLPYAVLGGGLWTASMGLLGYFFSRSFSTIVDVVGRASLVFGALVVVAALGVFAFRRLRRPEQRAEFARRLERAADRPALRPLAAALRSVWRSVLAPAGRFAAPRLRFFVRRLTPGELGLEFTTVCAVFVVAMYVFVLYAVILAGDPGLTPADSELLDLSERLETGAAVSVAKVVTALGSFPFVAGVVLMTAIVLGARRRWVELVSLVTGFLVIYAGVHLAKAGIDRPRPPDPLTGTSGSAWPSGHAAYSIAYVALAVIVARVSTRAGTGGGAIGRAPIRAQAALVSGAVALAAAIGLSRIYLRAHYWSDVAGGWALGIAVFSLCAAIALIVVHMRQNGRSPPSRERRRVRAAEPTAGRSQP